MYISNVDVSLMVYIIVLFVYGSMIIELASAIDLVTCSEETDTNVFLMVCTQCKCGFTTSTQ